LANIFNLLPHLYCKPNPGLEIDTEKVQTNDIQSKKVENNAIDN